MAEDEFGCGIRCTQVMLGSSSCTNISLDVIFGSAIFLSFLVVLTITADVVFLGSRVALLQFNHIELGV